MPPFLIVENWRTCHAMPLLTFRVRLGDRARRIDPTSIIAQRLKRFSSVMNKLAREPNMSLSQMQDLGGCRAILGNLDAVGHLRQKYSEELSKQGMKCRDYILEPKASGYRSIHLIGRYHAELEKNEPWNGQRVEIQLRSKLQHAFATAVETVTTFTREPLKFGAGPDEWRRFFALMGSALAIRESTPLVPGTPTNDKHLLDELRELTKTLKVGQRLRSWASALKQLPKSNTKKANWLLLVLDLAANTIKVTGFVDRKEAAEAVATLEQPGGVELDAVLVWVRSVLDLEKAYPNYYADTTEFLAALAAALKS